MHKIVLIMMFLISAGNAKAFLPPEFFVQGISSIWAVLAGGLAMILFPFLIFWKFIKAHFEKNKRLIVLISIQSLIIVIVMGVFFYFKQYKPLYEKSHLFPEQGNIK